MSIRIQDSCDVEHLRSDGGGQLWQRRQERQERQARERCDGKSGKKEDQHQNQNSNPARTLFVGIRGNKGHLSTECWSNPKNQSGYGGTQNKGGKGKPKNVTGKETGSLEQEEQAAVAEPQPQPALASSPDLASIETLVRSPHLDPEGWLRWTYDTCAAISAFTLDAKIGTEREANE